MDNLLIQGEPEHGTLILAHGAGAGMNSDFMETVSVILANHGIQVVRFNFDYMDEIKISGKRRPPDRQPKLLARFTEVIKHSKTLLKGRPLYIGGKSMGGRMATMLANTSDISGVVVYGYPFHPIGKPEKLRTDHLNEIRTPVLICQGERDTMGNQALVSDLDLPDTIQIQWLADGNHDLKPRKVSGYSQEQHLQSGVSHTIEFIKANID